MLVARSSTLALRSDRGVQESSAVFGRSEAGSATPTEPNQEPAMTGGRMTLRTLPERDSDCGAACGRIGLGAPSRQPEFLTRVAACVTRDARGANDAPKRSIRQERAEKQAYQGIRLRPA